MSVKEKQLNKKKINIDFVGFIVPLSLIIVWYFATLCGKIPPYILPSPIKFGQIIIDFIFGSWNLTSYSGKLLENLIASFIRVLCGFGLAVFLGLTLGFLTGRISFIKRLFDPFIHAIRTVPGIGWLPLAMVWFGVGEKTTLFLITLAAFFPIYINTAFGASEVSPLYLQAGKMLGANNFNLFFTIILPAAFPSIVVGLRLGLGISWAYLVLGELTGVTKGLGAVMMDSRMLGHTEMILTSMVCIAILGKITDTILVKICALLYPSKEGVTR